MKIMWMLRIVRLSNFPSKNSHAIIYNAVICVQTGTCRNFYQERFSIVLHIAITYCNYSCYFIYFTCKIDVLVLYITL